MDKDRAYEHALDGNALLFTGAGFSLGAVNLRNKPFKSGAQFANLLSAELNLPQGTPLDDASEEFATKFGEDRLIEELENEFTCSHFSKAHQLFQLVPWKRIYTTNYDDVMEKTFHSNGQRLKPVTISDDIHSIPKDCTLCVHLNGYVGRLTRDTIWSEVKATEASYLTALMDSPWAALFREDIEIARSVFFVGYSMSDLDIKRILFDTKQLRDKCFFVIGETPPPSTASRARRFGTILPFGTGELAAQLIEKKKSYSPPELTGPISYCLRRSEIIPLQGQIPDRAIFDLLLFGYLKPEYVWKGFHGGRPYTLARPPAQLAMEHIAAGIRAVVVHSELGNGKSLILDEIGFKALEQDFAVHSLVKRGESLLAELEWVLEQPQKTLILVDNYPEWLDVLKFYSTHANSTSFIVLTARTPAHDVLVDRLSEILHTPNMREINADRLSPTELAWISEMFSEYGLWGDKARWPNDQKIGYLSQACKAEWHAILVRLFESPNILDKFARLFSDIEKGQNYYKVVLTLLILSTFSRVPSFDILANMAGPRVLESGFRRDPAIREIVDFTDERIRLRSSVTGEFILKRIADPNATVQTLIELAKTAHKFRSASPYYVDLLKVFARFSNLQGLFPDAKREAAILHYFENIKVFDFYQSNPLFWLQYAIACLVFNQLDRAQKYFDSAYSFARRMNGFDSYQIDNHYARFLLMRAINSGDSSKGMADFRNARTIILAQVQNDRMHYPFRVASTLEEFYSAFRSSLKVEEKQEILRSARTISERIAKLPEHRQKNRSIVDCAKAMERILAS